MRLLAGMLSLLAGPAAALSLTVEIWDTPDPARAVFCTIHLDRGEMRAIEVQGVGRTPDRIARWQPLPRESEALTSALQALFEGAMAPGEVILSRPPETPFLALTWFTQMDGTLASGLSYVAPGEVPGAVVDLVREVLPGGLCDAALS